MSGPLRIALIGHGRMGRAVEEIAAANGCVVVAVLLNDGAAGVGTGAPHTATGAPATDRLNGAQVAIEFTVASSAPANVRMCLAAGCPVVSGTTGWDAERAVVEREARDAAGALLWAPNFSLGVHILGSLVEHATRAIAQVHAGFDAHLIETHHRAKVDAPSGTARMLADRAARVADRDVPITSVRTGSVPGTHEFVFDAPFEQLTLTHIARDRRVFASGALVAARWLAGRRGLFTLDDVFGPTI